MARLQQRQQYGALPCRQLLPESREKTTVGGEKKLKSREKILALIKEHPKYSARKLAEAIGITPKAVEKQLANLKI